MNGKKQRKTTKEKGLILTIELVPATSWYNNLRGILPKEVWDKIRERIYATYNYKCGICGTGGKLNCHEIWEYDDKNHVQKLVGFIALCDLCHHVKHIGHAGILASKGKLDYQKVVRHFMKVNACNRNTFQKHMKDAFDKWNERSQHEWSIHIGEYENLIKEKPIEINDRGCS